MDLELVGKRAIVTGGSRGIGLAVAKGAGGRGGARGAGGAGRGRARGGAGGGGARPPRPAAGQVITVSCDTGDDHAVRHMAAEVAAALGGVDILVNAAARPNTGAVVGIEQFDEDEFTEQVNVKVLGYLRCARAVAPSMKAGGWGRIINVSGLAARSSGAITGTVRNVAVAALTKNLADELGRDGINVTVVHPGVTVTEKTPEILADARRAGRGPRRRGGAAARRLRLHRPAGDRGRGRRRGGVPRLAEERRDQRRRDRRRRRRGRPDLLLTQPVIATAEG